MMTSEVNMERQQVVIKRIDIGLWNAIIIVFTFAFASTIAAFLMAALFWSVVASVGGTLPRIN
jgi:hypothetical protein